MKEVLLDRSLPRSSRGLLKPPADLVPGQHSCSHTAGFGKVSQFLWLLCHLAWAMECDLRCKCHNHESAICPGSFVVQTGIQGSLRISQTGSWQGGTWEVGFTELNLTDSAAGTP